MTTIMQSIYFSGVCECCLSENNLISMMHPIIFDGKIEVYSEMLFGCFSIQVINKEYPESQHLICEDCILRLRNSISFQKQITNVQSKLHSFLESNHMHQSTISVNFPQIEHIYELNEPFHSKQFDSENDCNDTSNQLKNGNCLTEKKSLSQTIERLLHKIKTISKKLPKVADKQQALICEINEHSTLKLNSFKKVSLTSKKYVKSSKDTLSGMNLICHICNDVFSEQSHFERHMSLNHLTFTCDICGKSFSKKTSLNVHMQSHEEKIPCKICNKVFTKTYIARHTRLHAGDNLISACPYCPEKFKSYQERNRHLLNLHNVRPKDYKCKICSKIYHVSSHLSQHVRKTHLHERNHACCECGKRFFSKTDLKYHLVKHTGDKKFKCGICQKCFAKKYSLSEHMKVHDNTKEYKCSVCDSTFTKNCSLKNHMKLHTNLYKINELPI